MAPVKLDPAMVAFTHSCLLTALSKHMRPVWFYCADSPLYDENLQQLKIFSKTKRELSTCAFFYMTLAFALALPYLVFAGWFVLLASMRKCQVIAMSP